MTQRDEDDPDITSEFDGIIDDREKEFYITQRLRVRRRMAILSFAQLLGLGTVIIVGGLTLEKWSMRIDHMATFLSIYFGALATIVGAYWGLGSFEHNAQMAAKRFNDFGQDNGRPRLVKTGTKSVTTTSSVEVATAPAVSAPLVVAPVEPAKE